MISQPDDFEYVVSVRNAPVPLEVNILERAPAYLHIGMFGPGLYTGVCDVIGTSIIVKNSLPPDADKN